MTSDVMEIFWRCLHKGSAHGRHGWRKKATMHLDPVIQIPHEKLYKNWPDYLLDWVDLIDKIELQGTQFPGKNMYDYDHIEGSVSIIFPQLFFN